MLENIVSNENVCQVIRISIDHSVDGLLDELQLDSIDAEELRNILIESSGSSTAENLLDDPFRPKAEPGLQSRFSDGSFPVFYSSMDKATAEAELKYWFPRYMGPGSRRRTAYYRIFTCTFKGLEKDLRSATEEWPELLHNSDYTFCNKLGVEAVNIGLDGLVTYSVRNLNGVNLPVFSRKALSNPLPLAFLEMTYDPETGEVTLLHLDIPPRINPGR